MDEYMTGNAFPEPLTWLLGAGLVLLVGWLIERSQRRKKRPASPLMTEERLPSSDDQRITYENLRDAWADITERELAFIVPSDYESDSRALRVWETHFTYSDLARSQDGWVAFLGVHVSRARTKPHPTRLFVGQSPTPHIIAKEFLLAMTEDAARRLDLREQSGEGQA